MIAAHATGQPRDQGGRIRWHDRQSCRDGETQDEDTSLEVDRVCVAGNGIHVDRFGGVSDKRWRNQLVMMG